MPAFHYRALEASGKTRRGLIEADSPRAARQLLRKQSLLPVSLEAVRDRPMRGSGRSRSRRRLDPRERMLITGQLATLLAAGIPVEEALGVTANQTDKPAIRALVLAIRSRVQEGRTLAASLADFPQAFPALYCATVAAGEKSGHLDTVLRRLADYTQKQYALRQKMLHALIYPGMMMLVAITITAFLLEFVVPRMIAVFSETGQSLPALTQVLLGISGGLRHWGWLMLTALVLLGIFLRWQWRKPGFRMAMDRFLLKLPLFGWSIRTAGTARFSRTFAILSAAGVSVLEAMTISASLVTSLPIRAALDEAVRRVREGAAIHLALRQTGYFSPMSIHMIASGESSGQLENMLERAADQQDEDMVHMINTLLALSEPIIILLMGGIVLFIVLAVLLPVFQLDQMGI